MLVLNITPRRTIVGIDWWIRASLRRYLNAAFRVIFFLRFSVCRKLLCPCPTIPVETTHARESNMTILIYILPSHFPFACTPSVYNIERGGGHATAPLW